MPGMAPMFGGCMVTPTATKGRYDVASDFGMAGTWRLQIAWNGPAGRGSATLPGSVL
jgi:YtkA-like